MVLSMIDKAPLSVEFRGTTLTRRDVREPFIGRVSGYTVIVRDNIFAWSATVKDNYGNILGKETQHRMSPNTQQTRDAFAAIGRLLDKLP